MSAIILLTISALVGSLTLFGVIPWDTLFASLKPPAKAQEHFEKNTKHPVLSFPDPTASEETKRQYADTVRQYAISSETLNISKCNPDPLVLKLTYKQSFTIRNDDDVSRSVATDKDHVFEVPAKSSIEATADFGKPEGIFAYGCDLSKDAVGVFLIEG